MAKGILLSILIMSVVLPINASNDKNAARGLKKTVTRFIIFEVIWVMMLVKLYLRYAE